MPDRRLQCLVHDLSERWLVADLRKLSLVHDLRLRWLVSELQTARNSCVSWEGAICGFVTYNNHGGNAATITGTIIKLVTRSDVL